MTQTSTPASTITVAQLLADGFVGEAVARRARFELVSECDPAARRRLVQLASCHSGVPTTRMPAPAPAPFVACVREIGA